MPHETVGPILAAARIVEALQSIVSREISPLDAAVVTIGRIQGGTAFNIIPKSVTLQGTARSFTAEAGRALPEKIARIVQGTAAASGVTAKIALRAAQRRDGQRPAHRRHGHRGRRPRRRRRERRDRHAVAGRRGHVASYLERVPGCFFFVGCAREGEPRPHHSPRFDLDERALGVGVAVLEAAARDVARRL